MKVLLTGGAGYIGSVVSRQLLKAGHTVTVVDNLSRGHREAVASDAEFIELDLRDREGVAAVVSKGFDAALHFGALALVGESVSSPELYWENNVVGSFNLLEALRIHGVERLVFSSTCAVYGEPKSIPIDESTPTNPLNPYGASKLMVDQMISAQAEAHGLAATSLRYFNVAGASGDVGEDHRPETHIVPNILQVALGQKECVEVFGTDYDSHDGTAIRDYIHIEDLGRAHLLALDKSEVGKHKIYNLGNGTGFTVRDVIQAAESVTGKMIKTVEAPRRAGDAPALVAASQKIQAELGWSPEKPELVSMVSDAWQWHQRFPNGYSS